MTKPGHSYTGSATRTHQNGVVLSIAYRPDMRSFSVIGKFGTSGRAFITYTRDFEQAKQLADAEANCPNCTCPPWTVLE